MSVGDYMRVIELPPNFWRFRDATLPRGEAIMKGMRLYDFPDPNSNDPNVYLPSLFWANTSRCFHGATNFTWVDVP